MSTNAIVKNFDSNYTLIFFNVQSVEEADTLLHAENHESQKCRALFAKLVAEAAQNGVVRIYVEGSPSEGKLKYSESFYKRALWIDRLTHDANISLVGWDYMESPEAIQADNKAVEAEMTLRTLQREKEFLDKERTSVEGLIASKMGVAPSIESSTEEIKKYSSKIVNLNDSDRACVLENFNNIEQLIIQLANLQEQIKQAEEQLLTCMNDLHEVIERDFPLRTSAMGTTLKKLRKLRKTNEYTGKAIFQAGMHHLRTSETNRNRPEFDLTKLYNELKKHRAVILIPKD